VRRAGTWKIKGQADGAPVSPWAGIAERVRNSAGENPVRVAEHAAEMRRAQEPPLRADRGDRSVALRGITQVLTTPLQPAQPSPLAGQANLAETRVRHGAAR
jgi:hypothetical protein